ncbi:MULTISPECIES: hypothetical protein [unclassified Paenibacillus]|jgi:hypothetical protein|uniref:hypothetical protein n=1 Tax=unclassified Paenibacillus TaxID=185978 RepID=UPI0030FBC384
MIKSLFLAICVSILLVGCSIQKISGPMEKDLEGPNIALKIAVVGANDLVKVENVDYVKKDLKELISHSEEIFDGLIISQDSIEEASKKEYRDYFKYIKYPVFFIGTENILVAMFRADNVTLEDVQIDGWGPHVSGFVNSKEGYRTWEFHLPDNPTRFDEKDLANRIAKIMEENKIYSRK